MGIFNIFKNLRFREKAISLTNFTSVPTHVPSGYSAAQLNFFTVATGEDLSNQKKIKIKNPYIQNAWVYAAIDIMATNLSQTPFKLYDVNSNDEITKGYPYELFRDVSPIMNRFQLWSAWVIYMTLYGEVFWILRRSPVDNQVISIEVPNPTAVEPVIVQNTLQGWKHNITSTNTEIIDLEDIIHFFYLNPLNPIRGLSPLVALELDLNSDLAANQWNWNFFNNNAIPSAIIKTSRPMTEDEKEINTNRWKKNFSGRLKWHGIAFLSGDSDIEILKNVHSDMEFISQRKWTRDMVFSVLNVPPALGGILEQSSIKSNIKEQRKQLYENNLIPKMRFIEDVLRTEFFAREKLSVTGSFDLSGIEALKEDFNAKVDTAEKLWHMGVPFSQINEKLNLGFKDVPASDVGYIPMNLIPTPPVSPAKSQKKSLVNKSVNRTLPTFYVKILKIEKDFRDDLRNYFYDMRSNILARAATEFKEKKSIEDSINNIMPTEDELKVVVDLGRPYILEAYEVGLNSIKQSINSNFSLRNIAAISAVDKRVNNLTNLSKTIVRQLNEKVSDVLKQSLSFGRGYAETANQIFDEIKNVFNNARSRAATIARTEINGALNDARLGVMKEAGVKKVMWSTSGDNDVRPSHAALDGEVVKFGDKFSNGLRWPHDELGDPAEVINCRCVIVPVE